MIGALSLPRALWRDERGVTIVEFALVSIPLLLIIFAGFDFGHRSYVDSVLQGALDDAARQAAVENPGISGTGPTVEARVAELILKQVQPIAPQATVNVTQTNYFDFAGIGNPEKLVRDNDSDGVYDDADGDCFEDLNENGLYDVNAARTGRGGANDVVMYKAVLTMDEIIPLQGFIDGSSVVTVTAETAIRNQPWDDQAAPPVVCGVVP